MAGTKWCHSNTKGKVGVVIVMDNRVKAADFSDSCRLMALTSYCVLKSEINRKHTRFLLDVYKQKSFRSHEQKSNSNPKNKELQLLNKLPHLRKFAGPEPFE